MQDYLSILRVSEGDKVDHGIKGMHWGVRTPRSMLRAARASGKGGPKDHSVSIVKGEKPAVGRTFNDHKGVNQTIVRVRSKDAENHIITHRPTSNIHQLPNGEPKKVVGAASGETSSARYARLQAQAKAGKASEMDEQDLKFFNGRTEALAKINKLNESDPGWLSKTSKKVLQQTAQNQMQTIADGVANKYISGPVIDALKSSATKA